VVIVAVMVSATFVRRYHLQCQRDTQEIAGDIASPTETCVICSDASLSAAGWCSTGPEVALLQSNSTEVVFQKRRWLQVIHRLSLLHGKLKSEMKKLQEDYLRNNERESIERLGSHRNTKILT
jgi:hypothetical protein